MASTFLGLAIAEIEQQEKDYLYRNDIRAWAKDKLGVTLWRKQVEIAEALIEHKRVAVKSGHGVGKSFLGSVVGAWFNDTRRTLDAVMVSTAPTQPQLDIVWGYMEQHHLKANLFGTITQNHYWKNELGHTRAFGRKPSNTNIHAFQGIHRRNGVLAILDESCGIPDSIFTAVDAITTGRHDYVLAIGNPDDINTPFGQIWTNANVGASWHKMTISSYDSPNLTGEDFPQEAKDGLVTAEWIEQRRVAWGEDSPRFLSKVLGEFSDSAANTLFTMADLLKGHTAEVEPDGEDRPVLGVDVARYGADESVVYVNHNGHIRLEDSWGKTDLVTTAEKVNEIALQTGAKEVRVDGVGVGAGVVDILRSINMDQYKVISLIGNAGSPDLSKWINARAYWYDTVRERMHKGEIDIDITDSKLSDELGDIQYHFKNNRSVLQVEKKEEIRERKKKMMSGNVDETGGSPDHADAFIYAAVDHGLDVNNPLSQLQPGDILELDVGAFLFEDEMSFGDF